MGDLMNYFLPRTHTDRNGEYILVSHHRDTESAENTY